MFKQLRDWMVRGQLYDKYNEFYVGIEHTQAENSKEMQSLYEQNDADRHLSILTEQLNSIEEALLGGSRFSSNYSNCILNHNMLPSYLNLKTANKILFTGELLQLFQVKSNNQEQNMDESHSSQPSKSFSLITSQFQQLESDSQKCKQTT
jgi:hypothetical protein